MEKFIVFRLGEEDFGIGIHDVVEILKAQKINPVPELPDFISGVITLRGEIIPIIDMRKRLKIKSSPKNERIIIIRAEGEKIGLIVDEVKEIIGFSPEETTKPPSVFKGLRAEYIKAIGRKKDKVVIFLDLKRFLTQEEKTMLESVSESLESQ